MLEKEVNQGYYLASFLSPSMHNDYLVKTYEGTYEFAHYNGKWNIRGDNCGAKVKYWTKIPLVN